MISVSFGGLAYQASMYRRQWHILFAFHMPTLYCDFKINFKCNIKTCYIYHLPPKVGRMYRRLRTQAILHHAYSKNVKIGFWAPPMQNLVLSSKMTFFGFRPSGICGKHFKFVL